MLGPTGHDPLCVLQAQDLARQLPIHMRGYCSVSDYLRRQAFLLHALRSSGALLGRLSARMH